MDGIVLINKEKGYTSHDVVAIVKKITKSKVGHTGTLDPNATGVLPLLLGNATKISKYLINHDKEYEAVVQLGQKTTTADIEGEVIEEKEVPAITFSYIEQILKQFVGKQQQTPPIYSAIKVNGKKLYDYARQGQEIFIEPRNIEIYNIELINLNPELKQIQFRVSCSKGTYIRSLCQDIAIKLGTVGYMRELKRTKVGNFYIQDAVTISDFENNIKMGNLSNIITIEQIFKNNKKIDIQPKYIKQYINGVNINMSQIENDTCKINIELKDEICRVYTDNKFIGLGMLSKGKLKRDLVI